MQAERYSRGATQNPLNYGGYHVPFLYSTNGEVNWTMLRVLKCRWTGNTGEADWLYFDDQTGLLTPGEPVFLNDSQKHLNTGHERSGDL